jgi:hypothetical protein
VSGTRASGPIASGPAASGPAASGPATSGPGDSGSVAPVPVSGGPVLPVNEVGIAALVVSAVVVFGSLVPFVDWFTLWVAPVGIVLGIVALALPRKPKGTAAAGLGLGVLALVLSTVMPPVYAGQPILPVWWIPAASETETETAVADAEPEVVAPIAVAYELTGSAPAVEAVWREGLQAGDGYELVAAQTLPFAVEVTAYVTAAAVADQSSLILGATIGEAGGDVTCRIRVGDRVVAEGTASGAGETAGCSVDAGRLRASRP